MPGQHHVEHDRVVRRRLRHPERLLTGRGEIGGMALLAEAAHQQATELRLVLDDQYAHRCTWSLAEMKACMKHRFTALSSRAAGLDACSRPEGGATGNGRLTALTGVVLLVLLAVEGATIPRINQLLSVHVFVGMLLLGPVALKLGSCGYRIVRYYTGEREYVREGPPAPLMSVFVAPVLVLSTLTLFGTGDRASRRPTPRCGARPAQGELHRLVRSHDDPRPRVYAPGRPARPRRPRGRRRTRPHPPTCSRRSLDRRRSGDCRRDLSTGAPLVSSALLTKIPFTEQQEGHRMRTVLGWHEGESRSNAA